jgi:hypothetical protein
VNKPKTTLQLRFLHQLGNGNVKSTRNFHERKDRHVVVATLYPPEVAPIHVGAKRQIFLRNSLRFPDSADRPSEGK